MSDNIKHIIFSDHLSFDLKKFQSTFGNKYDVFDKKEIENCINKNGYTQDVIDYFVQSEIIKELHRLLKCKNIKYIIYVIYDTSPQFIIEQMDSLIIPQAKVEVIYNIMSLTNVYEVKKSAISFSNK